MTCPRQVASPGFSELQTLPTASAFPSSESILYPNTNTPQNGNTKEGTLSTRKEILEGEEDSEASMRGELRTAAQRVGCQPGKPAPEMGAPPRPRAQRWEVQLPSRTRCLIPSH